MNKKLIVANLMLAVFATACGDSTYVPNGNVPFGQGTFNGLPNQPFNPMMNQPFANQPIMNQPFNWQNPQQQMILQNQIAVAGANAGAEHRVLPSIPHDRMFPATPPYLLDGLLELLRSEQTVHPFQRQQTLFNRLLRGDQQRSWQKKMLQGRADLHLQLESFG